MEKIKVANPVVDPSTLSGPALMMRVEPVDTSRVRVFVSFYLPRNARRTFRFSGRLWIQGANAHSTRIVADPRGMVQSDGQGRFSWDEVLGVEYLRLESLSGQITDFELELETRPDTVIGFRPLLDGALVRSVYVGSQLRVSPDEILLPVGQLALTPPERRTTVSLDAGETKSFTFGNLVPGTTYLAVLGSGAFDHDGGNNSARQLVPPMEAGYEHWPEFGEGGQSFVLDPDRVHPPEEADDSHSCWEEGHAGGH